MMIHRLKYLILAALIGTAMPTGPVNGDTLVSDISESQIAITSNFTGRQLILFGAISRETAGLTEDLGDGIRDVIVVIEGPKEKMVVRKKERIAGVWVNADDIVIRFPARRLTLANIQVPADRVDVQPLSGILRSGRAFHYSF